MHERERHKMILAQIERASVVTVTQLVELLEVSEATVRRDIAHLHKNKKLRRIRGGAEGLNPNDSPRLAGRPFALDETLHVKKKRAIARAAASLCNDGDSIIINGGTTTFQMTHFLENRSLHVLTNSWPIAEYLFWHTKNSIMLPGGRLYREQNIILSPFNDEVSRHFHASMMFVGAQAFGQAGIMETDPQIVQAEAHLVERAEKIIVLVDSTKFKKKASLVVLPLSKIDTVITDDGIDDASRDILEDAGINVLIESVE